MLLIVLRGKNKTLLLVYWMSNKKGIFLKRFHQCFMSKVHRYLAKEGLPLKLLLILDEVPGHSGVSGYNTEGVEVIFVPPNTTYLYFSPLIRGWLDHLKRTNSMGIIMQGVDKENIMKIWKGFNIADINLRVWLENLSN